MKVYLVRHGSATTSNADPRRPLSVQGRSEAEKLADFLAKAGIAVQETWHSSKDRARETAEILVARGGLQGAPRERSGLLPEDPVGPIADELAVLDGDVCIVGHLPFMGYLAAELTSKGSGRPEFVFTTCAMLCLERYGRGDWAVRWFVSPDLLP